jgi:cyclic pyranopterin phosphate synthase
MAELRDTYNRRIDYLRISVTDRCNLRCVYCMPPQGVKWRPRSEILSYDEILRIVEAAAALGIRKVRLTGGEPLLRPDIPWLVGHIAQIPGIQEISLTTNGILLERLARPLADAGLTRVNVSLDTLDADKFRRMTRFGDIERVWRGINAAEQACLTPIKINTVVIRGVNADELLALSRLTIEHDWHVRFIELMPIGDQGDWGEGFPASPDRYFSVQEMLDRLAPLDLVAADQPIGNGPARTFRIPGARGTVGFISPLGDHFCATCNRLRLTSDGQLRPCLLAENEVDVRKVVRQHGDLTSCILQAVQFKPSHHNLVAGPVPTQHNRMMCQIGG